MKMGKMDKQTCCAKIDAYKLALMNLLPPAERAAMHLSIESKDPTDGGEFHTWEMKTFTILR